MVAPNGARRGQGDHPSLPITDDELIETARACFDAGAEGLHAHIRDADGQHLLDADRYRALGHRLADAVPGLYVQVTSESAGRYDATEQMDMLHALKPRHVSVAFREMVRDLEDWPKARAFYHWAADAEVEIQHITYTLEELERFIAAAEAGEIPGEHHLLQLVLGTYDGTVISRLSDLRPLVERMQASTHSFDWMLCAFGKEETECLVEAVRQGGKVRVGFENSLWHSDGRLAKDNAERVSTVRAAIDTLV